jgi:hypothetical protein
VNQNQQAFLSCTTRIGFDLKLSRPMMEFLCACSDDVEWDRRRFPCLYEPDNWIATESVVFRVVIIPHKELHKWSACTGI